MSEVPLTLQPVPVVVYETVPLPEPPDVVKVIAVPATPDVEALEMDSAACAAAVKVKFTGMLVAAANTPDAAL